ncbi:MAG: alpha-hydroxy-acid oxidizing protein [Candidatus Brockarchaeota archaeon]|nr:alpha-hydroxy-acid oxidizing protein [Candidatus Brockarchaeota archaeon]
MLNRELKKLVNNGTRKVTIKNVDGVHYLAAGLKGNVCLTIEGSPGYFLGTMMSGPEIIVTGNTGWFAGDNITEGSLIINGHTGDGLGQCMHNGKIVVTGDAGDRVGALMRGGTILVGGDTGIMTGLYMLSGKIIVLGNLGDFAGEMIIGGELYFSGKVESLGKNAKITEVSLEEREELKKILYSNGFSTDYSFSKIVPKHKRPFYGEIQEANALKKIIGRFKVDVVKEICKKCGTCASVCPQKVLSMVEGFPVAVNEALCVNCKACMEYCPTGAIRVYPLPRAQRSVWNEETMNKIVSEAFLAHPLVRGSGKMSRISHFDDLVFLNAQVSRPPIDYYREPCETEVILGARYAEHPLKLSAPIIIGAMSFGAISKEAKLAIAHAAKELGIAVSTGEGGLVPEEREIAPLIIAQYASGRFGVSAEYLEVSDAVEIKIGQGAKPGQGGLLLGEKVVGEVSKIRGLPEGSDAISPARHLDIVGPEDLRMKIEQLREITDWKVPIAVKFAAGRVKDDVKIAAKAGADFIVVDGKPAGTGAAPDSLIEFAGIPTIAAITQADAALKEIGMRNEVSLVASGGIRTGADVAKALALGADAVAIATGVLVAIGCKRCGLCFTGKCPYGIATQDQNLRRRLNVKFASIRAANYLKSVVEELKMFTQLSGKTSVKNLEKEDLRALTLEASMITGVKLVGQ